MNVFLYDNMPQYMLIFVVLLTIAIFVYIKLAFPFWNTQPVYHPYDFWRALYRNPFRIHKKTLMKSKFCDLKDVEIVPFADASDCQKKAFVNIMQCYFLDSEEMMYVYNLDNFDAYMSGHMYPSYFSLYKVPGISAYRDKVPGISAYRDKVPGISAYRDKVPGISAYSDGLTSSTETTDYITDTIGCISSRSGELFIQGHKEFIYYVDQLVIKRDGDHRGISRKLFETHIYKSNIISKMELETSPIMVFLFRRDGILLDGIIPLVRCKTRIFLIEKNMQIHRKLPAHVLLTEIHMGNTDLAVNFLSSIKTRFTVFAITDIANFVGLIKSGVFKVFVLRRLDETLGFYLFRDTRIQYEGEKESGSILELVAAVMGASSPELFTGGFYHALHAIVKKNPIYKMLRMDDIADNGVIGVSDMFMTEESGCAYYLYNMVVPASPIMGSKVFIIF